MKKRLKKYAVEFYNTLLNEQTMLEVEAYKEDEAIEVATLQVDAYKNHWSDDYCEFHTLTKVRVMK